MTNNTWNSILYSASPSIAGGVAIYLRDLFIYNVDMISMVLKALYIVLLIVFWYLNIAFTAIVSFLKVSFFGLWYFKRETSRMCRPLAPFLSENVSVVASLVSLRSPQESSILLPDSSGGVYLRLRDGDKTNSKQSQMSKSKWQLKFKYLNVKTTLFCPLDFEIDLTFEPCYLTLFRV